jgi:hypothetical protein
MENRVDIAIASSYKIGQIDLTKMTNPITKSEKTIPILNNLLCNNRSILFTIGFKIIIMRKANTILNKIGDV